MYVEGGGKVLSRTADITHGFCISHGEISSSTRNLLFRLAVVAQICGLFHHIPPLSSFRPMKIHSRNFLSLLSFLCLSLSFFFSLFSLDSSTGVDTLSLSTADDSIEESRARQVGKERVSRQFRPSFIRFIPRVVKYPAAG